MTSLAPGLDQPGGQGGGPGGQGGSSDVTSWVTANGTAITVGGTTLYDLSGAATN